VKPLITRGVLVDLPAFKGVARLAGGYEVTLADVRGALARQGLAESPIMPGDAVLVSLRLGAALEHPGRVQRGRAARHRSRARHALHWPLGKRQAIGR
jgi:hypothetical protein